MKLRAKQSTAINLHKGLVYVRGPDAPDKQGDQGDGDVIEVPDDFVVQPDVFEILTPPAGGKKPKLAPTRDELVEKAMGRSAPAARQPAPEVEEEPEDPDEGEGSGSSGGAGAGAGKGSSNGKGAGKTKPSGAAGGKTKPAGAAGGTD